MRNFTIDFNLDVPIPPKTVIGRAGEHNAVVLNVVPPSEATENDDVKYYRVVFRTPDGKTTRTGRYYRSLSGDLINVTLPNSLTACDALVLQLEAYGENDSPLIKTHAASGLRFSPSVCGDEPRAREGTPLIQLGFETTKVEIINDENTITGGIFYGDFEKYVPKTLKMNLREAKFVNARQITAEGFSECRNLERVEGMGTLERLEEKAFENCVNLEYIDSLGEITQIPYRAFGGCSRLKAAVVPATASVIDATAFDDCLGIEGFTVDEENINYSSADGVLFNKEKSALIKFPPARAVEIYSAPEGTENVNDKAFYGCENLLGVNLPESVTSLGERAFSGCSSLRAATVPRGTAFFGSYCFCNCRSMTRAILLGAQTLCDYVFYDCDELSSVILGSKGRPVSRIDRNAFYSCPNLETLIIFVEDLSSPPPWSPWGLPASTAIQYAIA